MRGLILSMLCSTAAIVQFPQVAYGAGLLAAFQDFLYVKSAVDHCGPELVANGVMEETPDYGRAAESLALAMVENARLLRPDVEPSELEAEVDEFVQGWFVLAANEPYRGPPCNADLGGRLIAAVTALSSEESAGRFMDSARILRPYDQLQAFAVGGAGRTYAYPETQQLLLGDFQAAQPIKGDEPCAKPEVEEVTLIKREPREASRVPPFILPPIRYEEHWQIRCGDRRVRLEVSWSQDSESGVGVYKMSESKLSE